MKDIYKRLGLGASCVLIYVDQLRSQWSNLFFRFFSSYCNVYSAQCTKHGERTKQGKFDYTKVLDKNVIN